MWSGRDGHRLYVVAGASATALGDRNADGVTDFLTAAIEPVLSDEAPRLVLTWRSGSDGSPLSEVPLDLKPRCTNPVLSCVGDVDANGVPDVGIVVGLEAIVLSGKSGEVLQRIGPRNDRNPAALTGGIDLDGDHHADLLVGYPNESDEDEGKGMVVALSGQDGRELWTLQAQGGLFGFAICILGDVDDDGVADFVVGSHGESFTDPLRAYSGASRKLLWKIEADFDGNCHRIPHLSAGSDHAGAPQLLVGCPGMGGRCARAGYAVIVSGKTGEKRLRIAPEATTPGVPVQRPR
jgi:hypothetical protein